ncbi:MAG: hypothetical protein Q7S37_00765 [bacterium]|nr:hypothetical protein [bacterium]
MAQFLTPTRSKIILGLVLFLVLPITTIPMFKDPFQCGLYSPSKGCMYYHWLPFGGIYFITALIYGGNQAFMITNNYIYKGGALIIVSYLLSCAAVYIFKKLYPKKTSN